MTCLCGKSVLILENGAAKKHRPKKCFQPRFFEMSRKERKAMWCDIEDRLSRVQQKVQTVSMPILDVLRSLMEEINMAVELANN